MLKVLLCLSILLSFSMAYKILVVFPLAGKSHSILGEGYVRVLLEDGNEVTYITPFPMKSHPNLTQIKFDDKNTEKLLKLFSFKKLIDEGMKIDSTFVSMMVNVTLDLHATPEMQKLIRDPNQHFDLLIFEWMMSEAISGLSPVFNAPYIWAASTELSWMTAELIDESSSPAVSSDFTIKELPPFGFVTRVKALFIRIAFMVLKYVFGFNVDKAGYEKIFAPILAEKGRPLPPFEDVRLNASLMFGNSHISLGNIMALPQNYKPIGGYHIDPNVKPLPEDLQQLMDSAKDGVIYFSMGSNLKSKDLPDEIKKQLLEVFGDLKQTVIWKFEENLPGTPKNLKIVQWAPQPSILAHPNCRLFVTHGGLLSTTETVHFGVPTIGMPVFADQFINVKLAVSKGFAKQVLWSYNVGSELKEAINEVLNNPKYLKNVKKLSFIYHHRPVSPAQELKHWVRHVIETGGAPHLRSIALRTPFYQKYYLDLLAVILIVLFILTKIVKRLCCGKKQIKVKKH